MSGPQGAMVGAPYSDLESRFRELLAGHRAAERSWDSLQDDPDLDRVVQSIAVAQGITRQECMRRLLQSILDEDAALLD